MYIELVRLSVRALAIGGSATGRPDAPSVAVTGRVGSGHLMAQRQDGIGPRRGLDAHRRHTQEVTSIPRVRERGRPADGAVDIGAGSHPEQSRGAAVVGARARRSAHRRQAGTM